MEAHDGAGVFTSLHERLPVPVWRDGSPNFSGPSVKLTALKPRSALRRISSAATCGSSSQGSWQE